MNYIMLSASFLSIQELVSVRRLACDGTLSMQKELPSGSRSPERAGPSLSPIELSKQLPRKIVDWTDLSLTSTSNGSGLSGTRQKRRLDWETTPMSYPMCFATLVRPAS